MKKKKKDDLRVSWLKRLTTLLEFYDVRSDYKLIPFLIVISCLMLLISLISIACLVLR